MEDLLKLTAFSVCMLVGSYLAGSVPLAFTFAENKLRLVTSFGAGLLIGAALVVIIPEGVELLMKDANKGLSSTQAAPTVVTHSAHMEVAADIDDSSHVLAENAADVVQPHTHPKQESDVHMMMGAALVAGFVVMLLIDQLWKHSHSHSQHGPGDGEIIVRKQKKLTATIGLLVHAAADGIALGAAASTSKTDVEFVVFLAIMLHKAPAAFGLTSFLLHEGFDRNSVRLQLLMFSLAAPVMAFISYFGLGELLKETRFPITGLTMLFSAGTFLYVATVHVLNEMVEGKNHSQQHNTNTELPVVAQQNDAGLARGEVFCIVCGSLLPLLFNVLHSH